MQFEVIKKNTVQKTRKIPKHCRFLSTRFLLTHFGKNKSLPVCSYTPEEHRLLLYPFLVTRFTMGKSRPRYNAAARASSHNKSAKPHPNAREVGSAKHPEDQEEFEAFANSKDDPDAPMDIPVG
jgi:hypothetical protein